MNFLVDQNLPVWLAIWITDQGLPAEHVRRIGLARASDGDIVEEAQRRRAAIITKDGDFAQPPGPGVPVIWVRLGNTTHQRLAKDWPAAWPQIIEALDAGEMLVEVRAP
ncbi:MAG: DUF5615 family PIN-like protein [Oceanicaulis sp.]